METFKMATEELNFESNHSGSVFKNSCISPPRHPRTRLSMNQYERDYSYINKQEDERTPRQSNEEMRIEGTSSPTSCSVNVTNAKEPVMTECFTEQLQTSDILLAEVKQLKKEHQKTISILEKLFENQRVLNDATVSLLGHPCSGICNHTHSLYSISTETNISMEDRSPRTLSPSPSPSPPSPQENPPTSEYSAKDLETINVRSLTGSGDEVVDDNSITDSSSEGGSSPSAANTNNNTNDKDLPSDLIDHMWDGFSVNQYAPSATWTMVETAQDKSGHTPSVVRSPCITIPRPFSMTLREEGKEKKKSRSLEMAEKERLEKEAKEEAELQRQFKAKPVPPTTYLPLYEMINACNEERRRQVKVNSKKILKASERPFTFMAREDMKRKLAEEQKTQHKVYEEQRMREERHFQAKPVPKHVFDPKVNEKIMEEEEYRKIRIKVRALELLASSHLPSSMQVKGRNYTVGHLRKTRREEMEKQAFLTTHHSFHPTVNETVPDHKQAYEEFEQELNEKREHDRFCTVPKPFDLRIDRRIAIKKHKTLENETNRLKTSQTAPQLTSTGPQPSKSILKSKSSYPPTMTRSADLRQQVTLQKMAEQEEQEQLEEALKKEKRERQYQLQRVVSEKSVANDLSSWLDTKQRENLKKLRYI